jgi:hypothetical protein
VFEGTPAALVAARTGLVSCRAPRAARHPRGRAAGGPSPRPPGGAG